MKNLCFIDFNISNVGGIERVLVSLCNELSEMYNVHIVSICGDVKDCHYNINSNIKCYSLGNPSESRIRGLIVKSSKKLIDYVRENDIDVVFMVGHFTPPIVLPIKPFVNSKFVFCDHGALMNQYDDKKAVIFRKLASKLCDKTVVLTERTLNDYIDKFGVKKDKMVCIYNWLDGELMKYTSEYDSESKMMLSCGRLSSEKGYDMLLDIAKGVFSKYPDWQWHIYGDGEQRPNLEKWIREENLERNVILKGSTDKMYEKYKHYGMYVMTSYREGLPLVLLEAKANHLPIISFDCLTGPSEIVRDGFDGYLIECYNKESMIKKICELIRNKEKRILFSQRSTGNLNLFDKTEILEKWISLINNLL